MVYRLTGWREGDLSEVIPPVSMCPVLFSVPDCNSVKRSAPNIESDENMGLCLQGKGEGERERKRREKTY
jgi:hypothetical protein